MRIRPFDYWAAPGLDEALNELDLHGADAKVIAGGTDLVLNMKKKNILPRRVISLHNLHELDFVKPEDSGVRIGALTKHADLAANPFLKQHLPILCEAVGLIGSWQIRNVGTIGGNLCNASPAADSAPPLLVLDAQLILASKSAEKKIPLDSFFTGPGETALEPGQILKEIVIELPKQRCGRLLSKTSQKKSGGCIPGRSGFSGRDRIRRKNIGQGRHSAGRRCTDTGQGAGGRSSSGWIDIG